MSDVVNIRKNTESVEKQNRFDGYSKVIITVSDEVEYTAGTDSGRTLTLLCPWGTQKMANDILRKISGHQYQPYTADGAILDPAAELGDAVSVGSLYSGIYKKDITLGPLYRANIAAPGGEEINYKYEYKSPVERSIERQRREVRASLRVQADRIEQEVTERKEQGEQLSAKLSVQADLISAKVSKTGGNSSFSWELTDSSWAVKSNGSDVLRITKDVARFSGAIDAKSGTIGGFSIQRNYLSYNGQTWGGTNSSGIYIGQSGIQLGKNFRVDSSGNLTAASGKFSGAVSAGRIQYGGENGYMNGYGIQSGTISGGYNGEIGGGTITTHNTTGGINASLGYGDFANGVFNGYNRARSIASDQISAAQILHDGMRLTNGKITYVGGDGRTYTENVVMWRSR